MPKLVDVIEVAEALENKAVFLAPDRCVAVRNRNSSCRKCSDVCPVDAVATADNMLALDDGRCVACGACTTVCPTEALIPLDPLDDDLAADIADAVVETGGMAVFACARIASRREGDPDRYAVVPCLGRMEESILLGLAAQGVEDIVFVDGTCSTCRFRTCDAVIDEGVASVDTLLAAQGSPLRVRRVSAFPEQVLLADERGLIGAARRGFFSQARDAAKEAAKKSVKVAFRTEKAATPTLRDRLSLSEGGTLPQFHPERNMLVLDALDDLGQPVVSEVEGRLFGSVSIDDTLCSACGMCAVFCPTGALTRSDVKPENGVGSYLEFSAAECVQCDLCADVCLQRCLRVDATVSTEELFDFEPRLIPLPDPPDRMDLFSGSKR